METCYELQKRLRDHGIPEEVVKAVLAETTHPRRFFRVALARDAALAAAGCNGPGASARACALLFADVAGVGGPGGVAGHGTLRVPALSGLGKGRKHTTDGPAWSAAIRKAALELHKEVGGGFAPDMDCEDLVWKTPLLDLYDLSDIIPPPWRYTIAREGRRTSLGFPGWFSIPIVTALPEAWGRVCDSLLRRLRERAPAAVVE